MFALSGGGNPGNRQHEKSISRAEPSGDLLGTGHCATLRMPLDPLSQLALKLVGIGLGQLRLSVNSLTGFASRLIRRTPSPATLQGDGIANTPAVEATRVRNRAGRLAMDGGC